VRGARLLGSGNLINLLTVGAILLGFALRIWLLASDVGAVSGDEAVSALMAQHMLRGDRPTFYWGQSYGGALEVYLVAAVFKVAGAGAIALRVVPIALWALASLVVWRIGRRLGGEARARLAAAVVWAAPAYPVWKSSHEDGYYGVTVLCGVLLVLLALRIAAEPRLHEVALFGLLVGVGWWSSPQILVLAAPCLAWLALRRGFVTRAWAIVPGFVLGAFPWLDANVGHGWPSLNFHTEASTVYFRAHALVSATLPSALGFRLPYSLQWVPTVTVGAAGCAVAVAGLAWVVARRRSELALPLVACALFPFIYVASPYTWLNTEPRYFFLLFPIMGLVLVLGPRRMEAAAMGATLALVLAAVSIGEMVAGDVGVPIVRGHLVPVSFAGLEQLLRDRNVDRAYADYWVAFPLTYETNEGIIAAASTQQRYHLERGVPRPGRESPGRSVAYADAVAAAAAPATIFLAGDDRELPARPVFRRAGYRLVRVPGFDVYLPGNGRPVG
jgi:hypothetical protein